MSEFYDLPFSNVSDDVLLEELQCTPSLSDLNDRLNDSGLKDFLAKISKNEEFKLLDSAFYTCEHFNNKFMKYKSNLELSIFHLNIRSLNSKQRSFCQFMDLLDVEFDIIVLSEIWSYNLDYYQNILDGYSLYSDLPSKSNIGGLGMFIKKTLNCKLRNDLLMTAQTDIRIENLWFEIEKNRKKYIVGGIYRHPNQSIQSFTNLLEQNLIKINKGKTPCFITGDFNIDFLKAENNRIIMDYLNNLLLYNFLPVLLLPTRITRKTATLIDHIYYYEGNNKKMEQN